jgi:hypothetical protein
MLLGLSSWATLCCLWLLRIPSRLHRILKCQHTRCTDAAAVRRLLTLMTRLLPSEGMVGSLHTS